VAFFSDRKQTGIQDVGIQAEDRARHSNWAVIGSDSWVPLLENWGDSSNAYSRGDMAKEKSGGQEAMEIW